MQWLVNVTQVLTLFQNVLSNKDGGVCKQDVHQLIDAAQTLQPHFRLHACGQVGVVVIERGDDIELDLDNEDTFPKVVFRGNLKQQL